MTLTRPPRLVKPERETSILQLFRGNSCNEILLYRKSLAPRNTIRIWFGKAGAHPQLAWESQLPLKPCSIISTFCFEGNCDSSSSLLDFYYSSQTVLFASQMWATRPHLGSIFVKLLHRKTFICLRLAPSSPIYIPLTKKSRTYRPALPHAAFALIRFFRTIQPVNHLPASASDNLFQSLCS